MFGSLSSDFPSKKTTIETDKDGAGNGIVEE
jgi:hypothetical protein